MILPLTVPVSNKMHRDAIARQLSVCLDTAPTGRDRPQMKNGRDDDRLAAVLVPLIWRDSNWQILMTKRAAHLSHHPSQISFPGGTLNTSDEGFVDTALREAQRRNQFAATIGQRHGRLDASAQPGWVYRSANRVGIIRRDIFNELRPDPSEVESIFILPLAHIGQPDNFSLVPRQTNGHDNSYWVVSHPEHYIWGLSARVLNDLRQRLFTSNFGQCEWSEKCEPF